MSKVIKKNKGFDKAFSEPDKGKYAKENYYQYVQPIHNGLT